MQAIVVTHFTSRLVHTRAEQGAHLVVEFDDVATLIKLKLSGCASQAGRCRRLAVGRKQRQRTRRACRAQMLRSFRLCTCMRKTSTSYKITSEKTPLQSFITIKIICSPKKILFKQNVSVKNPQDFPSYICLKMLC